MEELNLLRVILSLVFVLGLIGLLAFAARKFGLEKRLLPAGRKSGRLAVEEMLMLDARHKLLLVRRDEVRHLLLVSPTSMLLVENDIPAPPVPQEKATHA